MTIEPPRLGASVRQRSKLARPRFLVIAGGLTLTTLAFLMLWAGYAALPTEVVVMRNLAGQGTRWAAKSPMMVFRVAIIGLVSVLAATVMLLRADTITDGTRRSAYSDLFSILLIAAAVKSMFGALEFMSHAGSPLAAYARLFWLGTVASVLLGIGWALRRGWPVLASTYQSDWHLARHDRVVLGLLALAYLFVAAWPFFGSQGMAR